MNTKLAQVDRLKKQKREQLNQQQLINAQTSQANAAQRQVNEAEYANIMQGFQNINNNLQMQQLNQNLMDLRY
jgi:hypothetical protein